MNLNLEDKSFIVSGSSRGVGLGIAKSLLNEGAKVFITGLNTDEVSETFNHLNCKYPEKVLCHHGDLNSENALKHIENIIISKWGKIDGIVANAGAVKPVSDWEIDEKDWRWYFDNNLFIAINFITKFIPHLIKSEGNIIITGSIAGIEEIGAPIPYSASKAALTMYAKGLSKKLAKYNVRVNTIAPGNIFFKDGNWDKRNLSDPEGVQKMLNEKVPLKRFGTPEDIGNLVVFLLSDKSDFITGSCMVIDGGQTELFI